MSRFIVDQTFWDIFPDAKIGVLSLDNLSGISESPEEIKDLLAACNEEAKKYLTEDVFSQNRVIQVYRRAYQQFKTKKRVRSAIENLLKRSEKDNPVPPINTLVDIYNAGSLKYALPIGAFDKSKLAGDVYLAQTDGGDDFRLIGEEDNQPTLPGEVCYLDDLGCISRCLNWRDCERTSIQEGTLAVFMVTELIDTDRLDAMLEMHDFISHYAKDYLNANTESVVLDINNREYTL